MNISTTPIRIPHAKVLFIFGTQAATIATRIFDSLQNNGIKIDVIPPENPHYFFVFSDKKLDEFSPEKTSLFYEILLRSYHQVFVFLSPDLTQYRHTKNLIAAAIASNKVTAVGLGLPPDDTWRRLPDGTLSEICPLEIYKNGVIQPASWSKLMMTVDRYAES